MRCSKCGAFLPDKARFCNACGASAAAPLPAAVAVCFACGFAVPPGQKFCMRCGARLTPEAQGPRSGAQPQGLQPAPEPGRSPSPLPEPTPREAIEAEPASAPPPEKSRSRLPIVLVGLAALVILAVLVVLAIRGLPDAGPAAAPLVASTTGTPAAEHVALQPGAHATPAPADLDALWANAQARAAAGAWEEAVSLVDRLRSLAPAYGTERVSAVRAEACANLARRAEAASFPADAQKWWDCVMAERPNDARVAARLQRARQYQQGVAALAARDYPAAVAAWLAVHSAESSYADVKDRLYQGYMAYGDSLCAQGGVENIQKGRAQYGLARAVFPEKPDALAHLAGCQMPTPIPTATPTPLPGPHLAVITGTDSVRVRAGPGYGYLVLGMVDASSQVTVAARSPDTQWIFVRADATRVGWIKSDYLNANYVLAAAPPTVAPPLLKSVRVADPAKEFSGEQGKNDWFYLVSDAPNSLNFGRMPWNGRNWYNWCCDSNYSPAMRLSADGGHPSVRRDVARLWVNPYEGTLHVTGQVAKETGDGRGGNGVYVRILQNKDVIWERTLGSYDTTGVTVDVTRPAKVNDEFYFIIGSLGNEDKDNTLFAPVIDLLQPNGVDGAAPTRWLEAKTVPGSGTPAARTAAAAAAPAQVCYIARLRQFEDHRGCCAEIVGVVFDASGRASAPRGTVIHVEGPPAGDRYIHEFGVDSGSGGYEVTALSYATYTVSLRGPNLRSQPFEVKYPGWDRLRAIIDFYPGPC